MCYLYYHLQMNDIMSAVGEPYDAQEAYTALLPESSSYCYFVMSIIKLVIVAY